jgi:hypothetical protein
LLPGVVFRVDVVAALDNVKFNDGKPALSLCVFPDWMATVGTFLVTVQVSAEEADPVTITVKIKWTGEWDSLTGEPV